MLERVLGRTRFALARPRAACALSRKTPIGDVTLHAAAHAPVLDALAGAPMTFDELSGAAQTRHMSRQQLRQAVFGAGAFGNVLPALPEAGAPARRARTARYNAAVLSQPAGPGTTTLASPVPGAGVELNLLDLELLRAPRDRDAAVETAFDAIRRSGPRLQDDAKPVESARDAAQSSRRTRAVLLRRPAAVPAPGRDRRLTAAPRPGIDTAQPSRIGPHEGRRPRALDNIARRSIPAASCTALQTCPDCADWSLQRSARPRSRRSRKRSTQAWPSRAGSLHCAFAGPTWTTRCSRTPDRSSTPNRCTMYRWSRTICSRAPVPPASFDTVHARFQIAPLGRAAEHLAVYRRLARPGGWIVLEGPDMASWRVNPDAPAVQKLIGWVEEELCRREARGTTFQRQVKVR